ncbi:TonB-dependent receptor [Arcticibacter tournemirensis]
MIVFLQFTFAARGQKISIAGKNIKLEEVLKEIRKQSGYGFLIPRALLRQSKPVDIKVSDVPLEEVLQQCFQSQPFSYRIDNRLIVVYGKIEKRDEPVNSIPQLPDIVISGTVTDVKGDILPGVTVMLKGTKTGTTTNNLGAYSIKVPPKSVLIFQMVGFKPREVAIGNEPILNIQLEEDNKLLSEVVVVGYGQQRKISITGAVSTVNVADVTTSNRSFSNALAGKVAGIISMQRSGEPGYDNAQFTIRGIGTFTGNSNPLIIIDGVQRDDVNSSYAGAYNNIDPEDIQSISLLKDASSTAVYGAKGANGVLIITTKRGVAGKPSISLKMEANTSGLTKIPKMLGAVSWMNLYNEASVNGGGQAIYSEEVIQKTASGLDPYLYPDVDWINSVYKDWAPGFNTNLNVNGGSPTVRYYVSASFYDQEGSYKVTKQNGYNPNLNFKRYDFRTNLDINLNKTTTLSMNLDAMLVNSRYPGLSASNIWYQAYSTPPNAYPIRYEDGKWAGPYNNSGSNPVNNIQNTGYASEFRPVVQSIFTINQSLDRLVNGLSAMARFSFDSYSQNDNRRSGPNDLYLATSRDEFGNLIYGRSRTGIQFLNYSQSSSAEKTMYFETNLSYDRAFGKHRVGGLLLYNMRSRTVSSAGDVIHSIPYNNQGLAARTTYAYNEKYLLELNAGYTGSENFQEGSRFGFFPSVSAGWVISKEAFFKPWSGAFNLLKIRGSHGTVGNDQIGSDYEITRFPYLTQFGDGQSVGLGPNGAVFTGTVEKVIGVEGLTWEKATKSNLGLEIGLFNKLNITVDAYKEKRTNILVSRGSLSGILGVNGAIFSNLGEMDNKGIEGNVEYNQEIGKVSLRMFGNLTYNNNKIRQKDEPRQLYSYQQATGRKYGDELMYIAEGLFVDQNDIDNSATQFGAVLRPGDIKYKDVNDDGKIDSYDKVYTGKSAVPTILYGAGFSLGYKKFDFSLFFQGIDNVIIMANGSAIRGPSGTSDGVGVVPFTGNGAYPSGMLANLSNRWTADNPRQDVDYPRLSIANQNSNNYQPSTWWSKDGSFLRLKQAAIGYKYTSPFLEKKGVNSLYLYLSGQNLLTFSKFKLWDPEIGSNGGSYPPVRIIALGLKAAF